jgi:hypothetical protein
MLVSNKTIDGKLIASLSPCSECKIRTKCNQCGLVTETTYANYNKSQTKMKHDGKTFCRHCAVVLSASLRRGKPAWNKGQKLPLNQRGKNHASWNGGRYISNDGYVMLYCPSSSSSKSKWNSYKKEHILVVTNFLGRKLAKGEIVHHIDGIKINNKIENLFLTNHKGHRIAHASLQQIGYKLIQSGLIKFNLSTGKYELETLKGNKEHESSNS